MAATGVPTIHQRLIPDERHKLLLSETRRVLLRAKRDASTAVDHYRSSKSKASGVPRQSRQYLSKMSYTEIKRINDVISQAIAEKNVELVTLLMDRDSLHMEHDSLLVDIEDFTEHESQASALDFLKLLKMQDGDIPPAKNNGSSAIGPTFPGHNNHQKSCGPMVSAPTPLPTPTSPHRSFVTSLVHLPQQLPKSLSRLAFFTSSPFSK